MATKTATKAKTSGRREEDDERKPSRQAAARKPSREVATTKAGPPAALLGRMEEEAGKGLSQRSEDNLVPLIYILQDGSPQVKERDPDYIDGAKPGMIWLRNAPDPLIAGEEGILVQPCFFYTDVVEWVPRDDGGGIVARYKEMPEEAVRHEDKKTKRVTFKMPNGNELVDTRYFIVNVYIGDMRIPYVLPMKSTAHKIGKALMFMMNSKQLPNGKRAPSFACRYRLTTKEESNASGDWFNWDVVDAGWVETIEEIDAGASLHAAFAKGEKQAEEDAYAGHPNDRKKDHGAM